MNLYWSRLYNKAYKISKSYSRRGLYEGLITNIACYADVENNKCLNVGSGGEIADIIASAGCKTISLDIDKDRKPDVVGSVTDMHMFPDGEFDVIFLMEVLEHVQNPFQAANEIFRTLRSGGVLIGSTPFILGIHDAPHDYYRYTKYGLEYIFRAFRKETLVPRNDGFAAASVIPLRRIALAENGQIKYEVMRFPLILLASWLTKLSALNCPDPTATTGYLFVFRKP